MMEAANPHQLGQETQWGNFRIFFGSRNSQLANLKTTFPELSFLRVKQVHGNHIIEVTEATPDFAIEADGLISCVSSLALCSISADCVPVLVACPDTGWMGAFHAGWRGVAARIIPIGLQALLAKGGKPTQIKIWIGPHIAKDSFEIQADVKDQILRSLPQVDPERIADLLSLSSFCTEVSSGKFNLSLLQVLLEQIAAVGIPLTQIETSGEDTKTNPHYFSARRDKDQAGRQISWIARRV